MSSKLHQKSLYRFLWSDNCPHWNLERNIGALRNFRNIIWNQRSAMLQVSRDNKVLCFFSIKDLEKDKKDGRLYFDEKFSKEMIKGLEKGYANHWKFCHSLKKVNFSKLSKRQLISYLIKGFKFWSLMISYFRATQAEPTHHLVQAVKRHFSDDDAFILMLPTESDIVNREQMDWQKLLKYKYSVKKLLDHAAKYPWSVMRHYTYDDVIETLTQKFNYEKGVKFKNLIEEKQKLKHKQKRILKNHPELKPVIKLIQRLALSRMEVKSCWGGTDFYLIPLFSEIARRSGESVHDLSKYYLLNDIKKLLFEGKGLFEKEKKRRGKCFVGLWKNNRAIYKSGEEGEKLARAELKELYRVKEQRVIKGIVANPGRITGIVRILEANNIEQTRALRYSFQRGQILVTQMTQPSVMDLASKASALITDEGGMLSHAAIISRELKIPCIVGTHHATQVLKNGDLVEVDANKGVVRILRK